MSTTRHRAFLPLFRSAVESFDLSPFDVIISSHHTVAKGLLRGADQFHICYCHTPMRALWERTVEEIETLPLLARPLASALLSKLRLWDYATAARVDAFIANSRVTQERIAKHYRRESTVLAPPINVERFTPASKTGSGEYYLVAARNVPYKRVDIAVGAAKAANVPLIVAGGDHPSANGVENVKSVGIVDDSTLLDLMRGARALLFPQKEDFGMTPLEMNAVGRPSIAYAAGGALDTVIDGITGVLVEEQSVQAFATAIRRFESMEFDPADLRRHAERFSKHAFIKAIREIVDQSWTRQEISRTSVVFRNQG